MKNNIFAGKGFGFFVFSQRVLPSFLAGYAANLVVFYVSVVYVIATIFRAAFVPKTWEIFIIDAPFTEHLLQIC